MNCDWSLVWELFLILMGGLGAAPVIHIIIFRNGKHKDKEEK